MCNPIVSIEAKLLDFQRDEIVELRTYRFIHQAKNFTKIDIVPIENFFRPPSFQYRVFVLNVVVNALGH